jgi:hypothetical protein
MSGIGPVAPGVEFPEIESPRRCYDIPLGVTRQELAPDSVGVPAPPLGAMFSTVMSRAENSHLWLPVGHHADLHIEHDHRVSSGPFVDNASWKWCWHITVSPWESVDSMRDVLHDKAAEVHFVIGGRKGVKHPVVIQCLPLNQYGKGLVHLSGTPETNRAKVIQVEICADEESIANFKHYNALGNLWWLCTHGENPRVRVNNRLARSFANPKRFTPSGYPRVRDHHGHEHVANNTHFDPTRRFSGRKLTKACGTAPHEL